MNEIIKIEDRNLPDVSVVLDAFSNSDKMRNLAPTTTKTYSTCVKIFFDWCKKNNLHPNRLTSDNIFDFKNELIKRAETKKISLSSIRLYLNSIKEFYKWAEGKKYYPNIAAPVDLPKKESRFEKLHLSKEQVLQLFSYFKEKSIRDFAIVNLAVRTGMREAEIANSNISDIKTKGDRRIMELKGKGHIVKDRFVILTNNCYKPIHDYLKTRKDLLDPLFITEHGRISKRMLRHLAKEGLRAIGLNGLEYSFHSLRHSAAVGIIKSGGGLDRAQGTLGHSSGSTTQGYIKSIAEEERLANSGEDFIDKYLND